MRTIFRLFSFLISLAATEGTCSDLEFSRVFHAISSYSESSSEFVIFHGIVPALCLWLGSDAIICSVIFST